MKTEFTISDAFKALSEIEDDIEVTSIPVKSKKLNEGGYSIDLRNEKQVEEAKDILNPEEEESEDVLEVIDVNADAIEHIKDSMSYVGQAILQCKACKACKFIDMDKLVTEGETDELGNEIYNVDDECPNCHIVGKGYQVIGQVGKVSEVAEDEVADEVKFDNELNSDKAEPGLDNDIENIDAEEEKKAQEEIVEPSDEEVIDVDNEIEDEEKDFNETDVEDDTEDLDLGKLGDVIDDEDVAEDDTEKDVKEDLNVESIPGLRIVRDEEPLEGSALLTSFKASYDQLAKLLGEAEDCKDDNVNCIWFFWYDGNLGYIYDWKVEDPRINSGDEVNWNIGGKDKWHEGWADEVADLISENLPLVEEVAEAEEKVEEVTEEPVVVVDGEAEESEVAEEEKPFVIDSLLNRIIETEEPRKVKVIKDGEVVFKGDSDEIPEELKAIPILDFESPKLIANVVSDLEGDKIRLEDALKFFTDDDEAEISIVEDDEEIVKGNKEDVLKKAKDKFFVCFEAPSTIAIELVSDDEEAKEDKATEEPETEVTDEEELVEAIITKNDSLSMDLIDNILANEYWINESINRKEDLDIVYETYVLPVNDEKLTESFKSITGFKDEVDLAKEKLSHKKDRKELAESIQECKNNNRPYRVTKSTTDGYRYDLIEGCNAKKENKKLPLTEANADEIAEITALGHAIGLETMKDLQNFYEREKEGDEKVIDTLRRYKSELDQPLDEAKDEGPVSGGLAKVRALRNSLKEECDKVTEEVDESETPQEVETLDHYTFIVDGIAQADLDADKVMSPNTDYNVFAESVLEKAPELKGNDEILRKLFDYYFERIDDLKVGDAIVEECTSIDEACKVDESWDDFNEFADISREYLPQYGEGETLASQAVTAVSKLVYKWFNDGDVFDNTYGLEGWANDLSSYANWLRKYVPETVDILDRISNIDSEEGYEELLLDLCNLVMTEDFLASLNEKAKEGTIYKCDGPFKFDDHWNPNDDDDLYECLTEDIDEEESSTEETVSETKTEESIKPEEVVNVITDTALETAEKVKEEIADQVNDESIKDIDVTEVVIEATEDITKPYEELIPEAEETSEESEEPEEVVEESCKTPLNESIEENGRKAFILNQIIQSLNDEEAYYGEWISIWPDETIVDVNDAISFFGEEEDFKELEDLFKKVYKKYHRSGLFRPTGEAEALAHKYDKELGLPQIHVIRNTNVEEDFDEAEFDDDMNNYFRENYEHVYLYTTENGSIDPKGNIILEGKIAYETEDEGKLREEKVQFNLKPVKHSLKEMYGIDDKLYKEVRDYLVNHPYDLSDLEKLDIEDIKEEVADNLFDIDYTTSDETEKVYAVHSAVEDYFSDLEDVHNGLINEGFCKALDTPKTYIVTNNLSEEKFEFQAAKQAINE